MVTSAKTHFSNSTNYDGLLKDVYLPILQDTIYKDWAFTDMIRTRSDVFEGGGNRIVYFARTQGSEGTGMISGGGTWVTAVPVKGKQMTENVKHVNAYIELTGELIKSANSGSKSAVEAVNDHFKTNIVATKNNVNRQLMGDGSGRMAYVSAVSGDTVTVTVANSPNAPFSPAAYCPVGAIVHIATFDSAGIATNGMSAVDAGNDDWDFYIDAQGVFTPSSQSQTFDVTNAAGTDYAAAGTHDVAAGDFVVRKGSYGTPSADAKIWTACLEMNGLNNLVSDGVLNSETITPYTSIGGLTRTSFTNLQSYSEDISAELSEEKLMQFVMNFVYSRQATPNLLLVTPRSQLKYFDNIKADRRFAGVTKVIDSGFTKIMMTIGDTTVRVSSLPSVPQGKMFLLDTKGFFFAENQPFEWVLGDGGNVLVQSHTADIKFASAIQRVQFCCSDPYRQAKGFDLTETF